MIAFSTDASVAARGVYLLSFLPETDVRPHRRLRRSRAASARSRALLPDNAYGTVVRGRVPAGRSRAAADAWWRWSTIRSIRPHAEPAQRVAQVAQPDRQHLHSRRRRRGAAGGAGAGGRRRRTSSACSCSAPGCGTTRASSPTSDLQGGWYAAPDAGRLPQFRGPLSRALRSGSGAHGDARL